MRYSRTHFWAVLPLTLGILVLLAMASVCTAQSGKIDLASIKSKACAPLQQQYEEAVAAAGQDAGMVEYQSRSAAMDTAAAAVLRDLAAHRADTVRRTTGAVESGDSGGIPRRGATTIMAGTAAVFQAPLPMPALGPQQKRVLADYYLASVGALEQAIAKYAVDRAVPGASDEGVREIYRLCMVLPFLKSSEESWSISDIKGLPDALKQAVALEVAEEFALRLRRPVTAYQLHTYAEKGTAARPTSDSEFSAYLGGGADVMLRAKEYDTARSYLTQATQLTDSPREKAELQFRLAEVLDDTGNPAGGAATLARLLAETEDDDVYGRATMLRLKYLYEAKAFNDVLAETPKHEHDARCEPYLAQILYITWVAGRQQDPSEADRWQKVFLDKYPDHVLGADMRFASAMGLLAESKYDAALKILDYLHYHYPDSKLAPRAKEIAQRLRQTMASASEAR